VTTSACQKIYGEIYWNRKFTTLSESPRLHIIAALIVNTAPDLLMVMMDNGQGSSKSRAGVFFLSAGFALTAMFENICVS
jgi:NCS1 family nucleobase:cation symporter-1